MAVAGNETRSVILESVALWLNETSTGMFVFLIWKSIWRVQGVMADLAAFGRSSYDGSP